MILYKYLASERIDVLENKKIRYTQFSDMNDPFEVPLNMKNINTDINLVDNAKQSYLEIIEEKYDNDPLIKKLMSKKDALEFAVRRKKSINADTIKKVNNIIDKLPDVLKEKFDKTMGALCLSEINNDQLMWSHYAEQHKGYIIDFS